MSNFKRLKQSQLVTEWQEVGGRCVGTDPSTDPRVMALATLDAAGVGEGLKPQRGAPQPGGEGRGSGARG